MSTKTDIEKFLHAKYATEPDKYFNVKYAWPEHSDIPNGLDDVMAYSPDLSGGKSYEARLKMDSDSEGHYAYLEYGSGWDSNIRQWFGKNAKFRYDPNGACLLGKQISVDSSIITEYRIFKVKDENGDEGWIDTIHWDDRSNNLDKTLPGKVFLTGWRW